MTSGSHLFSTALLLATIFIFGFSAQSSDAQEKIEDVTVTARTLLALPVLSNSDYEEKYTDDQIILHALMQDDLIAAHNLMDNRDSDLKHKVLFDAFLDAQDVKSNRPITSSALKKIQAKLESEVWQDQHMASLLLALTSLKKGEGYDGLIYVQDSISHIPNFNTEDVKNARYNSYYLLHIAYTIDRNSRAAVNAVNKLIEINQGEAIPYGRFSIIFNLGVNFEYTSNYPAALEISRLLLDSPNALTGDNNFIAHLSYGRNLMNLNRHEEAIPYIEEAIKLAPNITYDVYSKGLLIESLSQIKEFNKAREEIRFIEKRTEFHLDDNALSKEYVLKSKALIAAGMGDFKQAYDLNKAYSNQKIEELKLALSNDRREGHRRVLLSQELAEKELEKAALQLALDQATLARQRMLAQIYLGLLLLGVLLIAASTLIARKLVSLNRKLKIANNQVKEKALIKSQLLAMFSHEMLTPLNGIIPLADILQKSEPDEKKRSLLKTIEVNGAELARKIKDIILVSNPDDQSSNTVDVDIKAFLRGKLQVFKPSVPDGVDFNVRISQDMPSILRLDLGRLDTIVQALLSNAFKYTKEGEVRLSFYMDDAGVPVLEVSDTGHGMPNKHVADMAKAFNQASLSINRDNQGLGLGLTIVHLQCAIMAADFNMQSEEGVGTVAKITFSNTVVSQESEAAHAFLESRAA